MRVKVKTTSSNVVLPKYQREGDVGMDLRVDNFKKIFSSVKMSNGQFAEAEDNLDPNTEKTVLNPGSRILIGTGLKVEIPSGYEIQIRPRSGLAIKNGITVVNSPGTIDSNYRGEIGVCLINHGFIPFTINKGERIAQAVLNKIELIDWNIRETLTETTRGAEGFGSSGKQ